MALNAISFLVYQLTSLKILLHLLPFEHNIILRPPRGLGGNKMLEFERNKDREH